LRAATRPVRGRWQVIIVEDADRITLEAANALLKSLEEPPPRTVWVLCAPSADNVIMTIRSRTREVRLVTPPDDAVAALLVRRDGVDGATAARAARAAQGHIGRARALARDAQARDRRARVLALPATLTSLEACLTAASELVDTSKKDAAAITDPLDASERAALEEALGLSTRGTKARGATTALNELEKEQKLRSTRLVRDGLDRVLTELTTWYRDVLAVQLGAVEPAGDDGPGLVNAELADAVVAAAAALTPEATLRRIDAVLVARTRIDGNVAPQLAMEALMIDLAHF